MRDIIALVSAGLLKPKKRDHAYARKQLYLNYGLLTLATILRGHGHSVRLIHGGYASPEACAEDLEAAGFLSGFHPVLLSLPSHLAIGWADRFLRHARTLRPDVKMVLGGRWVVGRDSAWLKRRLPNVDLIVCGTAEDRILDLLDVRRWASIPGTDITNSDIPPVAPTPRTNLRYELVDGFRMYHPSIEISRGCGRGCAFCEEGDLPLTKIREPRNVIAAMRDASGLYDDPALRFYFEASWFAPTTEWARQLAQGYAEADCQNEWRCETRADTLSSATLKYLSQAGLRVIDVGLESASAEQLRRMNKTPDPKGYLRNASVFLRQCRDVGVWPKVNVMLYAGETRETIAETLDWMRQHRDCIKGVSVGALTVYGSGREAHNTLDQLCELGVAPVDSGSLHRDGFAHLHLSHEVDYEAGKALATIIAQEFMSDRDYYDLKSFGYFPRGYSYDQFRSDVELSAQEDLPFRFDAPHIA